MSVTGIYFMPLASTATSPTTNLVSHLRRRFPEQEPTSYHIDHRLFNDTSSQLPNSDPKLRTHTQILTLSHNGAGNAHGTFVGSTSIPTEEKKDAQSQTSPSISLITIPTSAVDNFTNLLVTKLQPHWYHRQSVVVDSGTSVMLKDGEWRISVGDVKATQRSGVSGNQLRGMLVEVAHLARDNEEEEQEASENDQDGGDRWKKVEQQRISALLDAVFKGTGEKFDAARIAVARTGTSQDGNIEKGDKGKQKPDWELAKVYMEVLRGTRG